MRRISLIMLILTFCMVKASTQSWPSGVHDPSSIVKDNNTYWIFGTGDGIYSKYSSDMVSWSDGPLPFPNNEFPAWILNYAKTTTDQFDGFFWAPDIIYMNDQYYLYYSCSVWGSMNSCIGVVVNKALNPADPDYEWIDQGDIGIYSSGGDLNAIDPSVMRGHDGKIWLTYGSFNKDGIVVTEIDSVSGAPLNSTRKSIANSYTSGGWYGEGEGGCLVYHDEYYYLFYNKGGCCNGIASSYYIVMGRSASPLGPFYDQSGKAMRVLGSKSGGTPVLKHDDSRGLDDRYFGPGHFGLYRENGTDYVSFHYYDPNGYYPSEEANYMGGPTLGLAKLDWGEDGWPSISLDFLEDGYYTIKNVNSSKMMDLQGQQVVNGGLLYQYILNESFDTQKWLFSSLGTGEYTISNYADHGLYLEASGADNNEILRVTSNYTGEINQKFRVLESPNKKILIYPSTSDNLMEIPFAYTSDYQIKLWPNTNHNCQRWYADPFVENLVVSATNVVFEHEAGIIDTITIQSNGSWEITVEDTTWLKVSPGSGSRNAELNLEVTENPDPAERANQVSIISNSGAIENIYVFQKENPVHSLSYESLPDIKIYPNPVSTIVNIESPEKADLRIYDHMGKLVKSSQIKEGKTNIEIQELNAGLYLFKITGEYETVIYKILKQ